MTGYIHVKSSSSFYISFLSRVKMTLANWPAPNVGVFIVQLVKHCSANAEAMGPIPLKSRIFFSRVNFQLFKLQIPLRQSYLQLVTNTLQSSSLKENSFSQTEWKFAYLFVNDQWKLIRTKDNKNSLLVHLKLKYSYVRKKTCSMVQIRLDDVYVLLGEIRNLLFSEDESHPSLYSVANSGRRLTFTGHIKASRGNLAAVVFVSNKFTSLHVISRISPRISTKHRSWPSDSNQPLRSEVFLM